MSSVLDAGWGGARGTAGSACASARDGSVRARTLRERGLMVLGTNMAVDADHCGRDREGQTSADGRAGWRKKERQ